MGTREALKFCVLKAIVSVWSLLRVCWRPADEKSCNTQFSPFHKHT